MSSEYGFKTPEQIQAERRAVEQAKAAAKLKQTQAVQAALPKVNHIRQDFQKTTGVNYNVDTNEEYNGLEINASFGDPGVHDLARVVSRETGLHVVVKQQGQRSSGGMSPTLQTYSDWTHYENGQIKNY